MRLIQPIDGAEHDDAAFHYKLISQKQEPVRTILAHLLPELTARFAAYRSHVGGLENLPSTPASLKAHKDSLIGLYANRRPLWEFLKKVQARSPQVCPMCGEPAVPTQYDHIVPKAQFPEFSVFALNLVPCCDACNLRKGDAFLSDGGSRLFVNPYSDAFLNAQFIQCVIVAPYIVPKFVLSIDRAMLSADDAVLCARHIAQLKLDARFQAYCEFKYYEIWRTFYDPGGKTTFDGPSARDLLNRMQRASVVTYGPNNWEGSVYSALSRDSAALKAILDAPPP